jgi:hypothetical protein
MSLADPLPSTKMKPTLKNLSAFALMGLLFVGCTTSQSSSSCCDGGKCDDMKVATATNAVSNVPNTK